MFVWLSAAVSTSAFAPTRISGMTVSEDQQDLNNSAA
jgi:hypothetical protein